MTSATGAVDVAALPLGSVGVWTSVLSKIPSPEALDLVRHAEALGFRAIWVPETLGRDPFVTAALALGTTDRLTVATGVANLYARDAVTMVNTQRTLEEAFPGRFLLGMGVSHSHLVSDTRQHDYARPYSRMVEYLGQMDRAPFRGYGPTDPPPRVLAALGPKMLTLAGERANGAHTYLAPIEHTARARELLGTEALLAVEQMVVLDPDADRARELARSSIAGYLERPNYRNSLLRLGFSEDDLADGGNDRLAAAIVAWPDPSAAVERVAAQFEAGATHVCVQLLTDGRPDVLRAGWCQLAAAFDGVRWPKIGQQKTSDVT